MTAVFRGNGTLVYREKKHRRQCLFSIRSREMSAPRWTVLFALFSTQAAFASQTLIGQKDGFNSDKQLSSTTYGSAALDQNSFVSASFTYARTPEAPVIDDTDTFYQGTLTVGYAQHNLGFDVGFNVSRSPLQESRVLGGSFGLTYVVVPESFDPDDYKEHALTALHSQIYINVAESPPLFWVRLGYIGNTLHSNLVGGSNGGISGSETAFT